MTGSGRPSSGDMAEPGDAFCSCDKPLLVDNDDDAKGVGLRCLLVRPPALEIPVKIGKCPGVPGRGVRARTRSTSTARTCASPARDAPPANRRPVSARRTGAKPRAGARDALDGRDLHERECSSQAKGAARGRLSGTPSRVSCRMERSSQSVATGLHEWMSRTGSDREAPATSVPGRRGLPGLEGPTEQPGLPSPARKPSALWAALAVELVLRERALVRDIHRP